MEPLVYDPPQHGGFAVHSPGDALDAFTSVASFDRAQILVLMLDAEHRGTTCLAVDDVRSADGVLRVGTLLAELAQHEIGLAAVTLASIRPGGGAELADIDRWHSLTTQLGTAGVTLLEWFVFGEHSAVGIGELVDAPWRWRAPEPARLSIPPRCW
ncbi:MAG TPA: hypothetical protein VG478_06440 [Acidimicrobiales bacterium]|nr:hypothetical protein [Acidimicrobiales bacterium]